MSNLRLLCAARGNVAVVSVVALSVALFLLASTPARAQALDDQIARLLSNNCDQLGFTAGTGGQEFDDNLTGICGIPQTTSGSSSGGGAASPQGSALSLRRNLVLERLERAKKKQQGASEPTNGYLSFHSVLYNASTDEADAGAAPSSKRLDIFGSAGYESLDRNVSRYEDGYDSSVVGGAVGIDYQFRTNVVAGIVLGFRKHQGAFQGGGDFDMTGIEPTLYASFLPSDSTFVQLTVTYSSENSDVVRNAFFEVQQPTEPNPRIINGPASSSTDASTFSGSVQAGWDRPLGSFTIGPRLGLNYRDTKVDPYAETGNTGLELRVDERTVKSFQGVVGFYGSRAFSTRSGVILPQVGLEYVHEFEDDPSIGVAQFVGDLRGTAAVSFAYQSNVPDSDFFNIDIGCAAVLANGIQPFVTLRAMAGNDNFDSYSGTIGVRFEL